MARRVCPRNHYTDDDHMIFCPLCGQRFGDARPAAPKKKTGLMLLIVAALVGIFIMCQFASAITPKKTARATVTPKVASTNDGPSASLADPLAVTPTAIDPTNVAPQTHTTLPGNTPTEFTLTPSPTAIPTAVDPTIVALWTRAALPGGTPAVDPTIVALWTRAALPGGTPIEVTPTPASTATPTAIPSPTVACTPNIAFVKDIAISDGKPIVAGEAFAKSWQIRNSGSCTLGGTTMISYTAGEAMGAREVNLIPIIAPGESVTLTIAMTAPTKPGFHRGEWRLCMGDWCFGQKLIVQINSVAPTPTLSPQDTIKANAKKLAYKELARNTEDYIGDIVYFRGQVVQVAEGWGGEVAMRVNVTPQGYGFWDDTVWVNWHGEERVLDDDIIQFYAEVKGRRSYTTVLGAEVTLPELDALLLGIEKD